MSENIGRMCVLPSFKAENHCVTKLYLASHSDIHPATEFQIKIVTPTGWYDLDFSASRMVNQRFNPGVSGNVQQSCRKTLIHCGPKTKQLTHLQEGGLQLDSFLNKPFYSCEGFAFEASLFDALLSVTSH
jgi:prophage antirepressor-like protein